VFHRADEVDLQCEILSDLTGLMHHFGPNRFYGRGCHGNATFTRYPVRQAVNIEITHSFLERRGILYTRMELESYSLEVLNTHLSLTHGQRRRQLRTLIDVMPARPEVPVLLAGDLNDWHGRLDRLIHRTRQFENALRQLRPGQRFTYPARRPLLALDRVYYRGFRVIDARVLRGSPWDRFSDHLPVEVEMVPILR
jgi:endonuclease/exonuclease/phosphatase family metal-dependent hydrolase